MSAAVISFGAIFESRNLVQSGLMIPDRESM